MANGIIIIDKPSDWTSMDVCAKLRGILKTKKIGHAGTLDPMATGVLPVFVGQATRAVSFAESGSKEYVAGLRLGTSNTEPAIIVKNEEDNTYNSHGTACAGIIAAERNNDGIGICGVAPKAKIMPISIDLSRLTPQQIVSGLYNACDNGADIISCSWGGVHPSSCIDNAIKYVMRYGRDRKGTLLVFASGNTDEDLLYPENSDSRILTVGAVAHCGARVDHGTCGNDFKYAQESDYVR